MEIDPITQYILEKEEPVSEFLFTAAAGLTVAALLALASKYSLSITQRYNTEQGKKCNAKAKNNAQYKTCMLQVKVGAESKKLAMYREAMSKCSTTKRPMTCKMKLQEYITKSEKQIAKLNKKIEKLRG